MKKLTTSLFCLLFGGMIVSASAQVTSPVSPVISTPANVHYARHSQRLRQPETPPAGGFWVSEDNIQKTSLVIIRYYDDQQHPLQVDTLQQNHINLKSRTVVHQLNERLTGLLQNRQQPITIVCP